MAEDLHVFQDHDEFRRFKSAGGAGMSIFRDPRGHGLTVDDIHTLEVRDLYLHDDVTLNSEELSILRNRQRHHFSSAIYRVAPE